MITDKIGTVSGYAALFNEPSLNLAEKGDAAWCEMIIPGALTLASNVVLDRHHWEFLAPVASTGRGTLQCGFDAWGLWFSADLYPSGAGYDVANALRGGRSLAASFTMIVQRLSCGEPADRVDHREPGASRALGVVLMRLGIAEINQHAVAIYLATKPPKRPTVSVTQR